MEVGDPRYCEVTCDGSPHLSCKRDQIKMTDYMNRRVTQPKQVTSPTWGPPTPCKQALKHFSLIAQSNGAVLKILMCDFLFQLTSSFVIALGF